MGVLLAICLAALFHSISSNVMDEANETVNIMKRTQKSQSYSDKVLSEDRSASLIEIEKSTSFDLTYAWETVDHKLKNIKNSTHENITSHQIKPRKGVEMFREKRYLDSLFDLLNFKIIINISRRLFEIFIAYEDENEQDPNTDEKICEIAWDLENKDSPSELINLLPACPCTSPNEQLYITIKGKDNKKYWWRKVIKSTIKQKKIETISMCWKTEFEDNGTMISQHCCYDNNRFLITHGPNVGHVHYITPDAMKYMRKTFQLYPAIKCDIFKSFKTIIANNDKCTTNPIKLNKY